MLSAIKIEDKRITNAFAAIKQTRQDVIHSMFVINQQIHSLMKLYELSHAIIVKYMTYMNVFKQQLEHIRTGVENILQGYITTELVSPTMHGNDTTLST